MKGHAVNCRTGVGTRLLLAIFGTLWVCLPPATVWARSLDAAEESEKLIVELLTKFRLAAATADADQYFDCLHPNGIFFGTDPKERFTFESLKTFLQPYFAQGSGWEHEVKQRRIFVGPNNQIAWFEEHSHRERVGAMRTTGVVKRTEEGWKIIQSHVSILIPNETANEVVAVIRKWEERNGEEGKSSKVDELSDEQRQQLEASFEYVWERIRDTYWDPGLGGVDWQAAYDELKPKLQQAATRADALRVLDALVSRMKVSHFSIIPKSAYQELGKSDEKGARGGTAGLDVRVVDDQVIVVSVTPDFPAAQAGVCTGWIVESIDDKRLAGRLAEVKEELADNPHARVILASAANARLQGRVGDKMTVTFRDGNDEPQARTFELVPRRGERVQIGHIPEFSVWVDIESLDDGIAYFRFNAFMNPVQVMTAYNEFMRLNKDASGIIIDVRGNGGGSGDIAMGMIGWLMPGEKAPVGKVILRGHELDMIVRPRPEPYTGPAVVLIDEMSVSAAEFFASGIKDLTDAHLIGTRTAGAVLGSQIERLPTGDGFQFAAANFISVRTGKTLEGIGVEPHELVEPNREMLLDGKDPAIEAAIQWIRKQNDGPT